MGSITLSNQQTGADDFSTSYYTTLGAPADPTAGRNQFQGYHYHLKRPSCNSTPLLGNVVQPPDENGFQARVTSFLMREPTTTECQTYNQQAYQVLMSLGSGYSQAGPVAGAQP